ncbi:HD-GYP domain-containing protein [Solibacillus sp. FSL K6-1523]|uniref:HD-GYP domain-containing protein n=1 Tax=Solibacillus sp. FSL K6-1523 TaxID=2921471 RepID=UPI0030F7AD54
MSNTVQISIHDVTIGDILSNDIFVNRRLLMKKDNPLSSKAIDLLKKNSVHFVTVYRNPHHDQYVDQAVVHSSPDEQMFDWDELLLSIVDISNPTATPLAYTTVEFYSLLAELDTEIRYGQILKNEADILYLTDLYDKILSNLSYRDYLIRLKNWDYYSYLHCIDAFILGTLFARKMRLKNLERLATGYLLHDIGKLKIPLAILQKPSKLTIQEFEIMKRHTIEGAAIFKELGLSDFAYLAESHHERKDGKGYPRSSFAQDFTIELEILQIIDVYSAITMKRVYRDALRAADAFSLLYRDAHIFNDELLTQFVDFIRIYPENSLVLLSDGKHAIVEKSNPQFPTSPRVKYIETGQAFHVSINNHVTIKKLISYQPENFTHVLNNFYNELIGANVEHAKKTYLKLVDNFKASEFYIKIFIPVYRILNLLQKQQTISESRYQQVTSYIDALMKQKIEELVDHNDYDKHVLLLVDAPFQKHFLFTALIGLMHAERIFPHILPTDAILEEVLWLSENNNCTKTCVIYDSEHPNTLFNYLPNIVKISVTELEQYLVDLTGDGRDTLRFQIF